MSPSAGRRGRPFRDDRRVAEGIIYRYRCGIAWRDMPSEFGPWQPIWKRHRRYSGDGTWDRILAGYCRLLMPVEKWTGRFRLTPRLAAAYSSRAIRTHLRDHGITAVIPQPVDQNRSPKTAWIRRRQTSGLRQRGLQRPQRRRTQLQHLQAVPRPGNALRQTRTHLPRRRRSPRSSHPADGFRGHTQAPLCMPASRLTVSLWLVEMMEMRQRRPS